MAELSNRINSAWSALAQRERLMVTVALFLAPLLIIYTTALEPALIKWSETRDRTAELERSVANQERVLETLQSAQAPDPDARAKTELKSLQARLEQLDAEVHSLSQSLVDPAQMLILLRSVLDADSGLVVKAARSLPVQSLGAAIVNEAANSEQAADEHPTGRVYLHPFELELEGSYTELYRYLTRLEALEARFYWDSLLYDATSFKRAQIRLRVHTLSTKENWLGT